MAWLVYNRSAFGLYASVSITSILKLDSQEYRQNYPPLAYRLSWFKMEWNEVAKKPEENEEFRKKEAMFSPVMSPSWSKASESRRKELEASRSGKSSSIKDKLKKIFD